MNDKTSDHTTAQSVLLGRKLARELTTDETEAVSGAGCQEGFATFAPTTQGAEDCDDSL